uniref:NADH-quinone oxidoreductase subunit D domain-containing protein n=1 Tax=Roseihalotalea indica TaxID=2867963 RepID=A0AA49GQF1_9BACT|nr:hypothetical protein K4G66_07670 [Tunicatimonas sp. TK19036]
MAEEKTMKYGARKGSWNPLKRWIAQAMAQEFAVLPVPGADVLRSYGLYLEDRGIRIADSPRDAHGLLVAGIISEQLAEKAAIAYAQIPRPRLLIFAGVDAIPSLPKPDIRVSLATETLREEIQQHLSQQAWSPETEPFETDKLKEGEEKAANDQGGHMHHGHGGEHHHHMEGGSEEKGDKQPEKEGHESSDHSHNHAEHEHHHHGGSHEAEEGEHQEEHHDHEKQPHHHPMNQGSDADEDQQSEGHKHQHKNDDGGEQEVHQHEGHDHHQHGGGEGHDMDHDMGGFMSMVAMTKDMPRSRDGLAMEMNEAHFGPFFPGLPGGLSVSVKLDGDSVMQAEIEKNLLARHLAHHFPSDPEAFVEHVSDMNPLSPMSFRLLAKKAVRAALEKEDDLQENLSDLMLLEKERVLSHLNWLSVFSQTIGSPWMQSTAVALHRQCQSGQKIEKAIVKFTRKVSKIPYLRWRLMPVGQIPEKLLHHARGPVARAAGIKQDARMQDKTYEALSFTPIEGHQNNAWGRLLVRLDEITQSIQLIEDSRKIAGTDPEKTKPKYSGTGEGIARIETPRGSAELTVQISDGAVREFHLSAPSVAYADFIPQISPGQELADALVGIASLDISPWEIDL